jgi:uncharacterized protein (DUF433 family)
MHLPDFLTEDPDGEIHLRGHRIGLFTLVRRYQEGLSAEQIAEEYATVSLALVHAVLAFYFKNKAEVDDYVTAYGKELDRQAAAHVPTPAQLKIRQLMAERFGLDVSDPKEKP